MKKLIIILVTLFMLTGCYDYIEIDDLVIIPGMIIDYKDENYIITSQIIENEDKTKIKLFTTKGTTIEECLFKISKLSNKDIFISHLKVLILTEDLIKNDDSFYDFFLRNSKSKMNFYVYIVNNKNKDKILSIYEDETSSALYMKDMLDFNSKIFSSSTPKSFLDILGDRLEYGINPVYPNISVVKNNNKDVLYLNDIISFNNKNNKTVLNDKEGIFYNIISNKLIKTVITIPCDNDYFSLNLNYLNTKYKWKNNVFKINVSLNGKISSYECKYDLNDGKTIKKLNSLANKYIEKNINNIINIAKKDENDFIGIGKYIYKHDNKYFDFKNNNWDEYLKNINVNVKSDITITSIGEMRQ